MNQKQLDDLTLQNAVRLEGVKAHLTEQMRKALLEMRGRLKTLLDSDDELSQMSRREMQEPLEEIDTVLQTGLNQAADGLKHSLSELAAVLAVHEAAAVESLGIQATAASSKLVQALLKSRPLSVEGITTEPLLEPFIEGFSHVQRMRISAAVKQGIAQGQTNAQIRQRIIGTKQAGYNDGLIGASLRSGDAVVQTATTHVASMVRQATAEENRDIVAGFRFLATLDGRTSAICRSLDGEVFPIDSGPRPPLHINCRSSLVIELKPEYKGRNIDTKRASKDGAVSAEATYYDWLKTQPESFQEEVLGKQRAQLFRDGGLTAKEFARLQLDKNFKQRTLADLIDNLPPVAVRTKALTARFKFEQLKRKFKHAEAFGIDTAKSNFTQWKRYQEAVVKHLNDKNTYLFGTYRSAENSKVFYNKQSGMAAAFTEDNLFITAFLPNAEQLENYLKNGYLQ